MMDSLFSHKNSADEESLKIGHHRKGMMTELIGSQDHQPIKLSFDNRISAVISESLADLYGVNEQYREFNTKDEETIHRFIYELEDPTNQLETLDTLDKQTKLLYEVIIDQLSQPDHPIHIMTKRFGFYFTKHYQD